MFKVNNKLITTDPLQVIMTLSEQLALQGINLIRDVKQSGNNIQFTCPWHNNGQERRASCGVSIEDIDGHPAGTVHCFTCGHISTLDEMISECFGYNDEGAYGRKWLIRNFITFDTGEERTFDLDFEKDSGKKQPVTYPEDLSQFRYYHPYMYKRKLTDEIINMFDIGYDKERQCITFPVYNLDKQLVFVARRSVNIKYFNYPKNVSKPVYGLDKIDLQNTKELIICESMINALTCWVYGKKGVALLGLGTEEQYNILRSIPIRKYILAFDGDSAGRRATERFKRMVPNKLITYYILPEGKDINDLSYDEFQCLKEYHS